MLLKMKNSQILNTGQPYLMVHSCSPGNTEKNLENRTQESG
jgi:hypothetical protein